MANPDRRALYLQLLLGAGLGAVLLIWLARSGITRDPAEMARLLERLLPSLLLQFPFLFFAVVVHEIGHLLAGWLVGAKLRMMQLGPLGLMKSHRRWVSYRAGRLDRMDGLVLMMPKSGPWTTPKLRLFIAGGPFASVAWTALLYFVAVRSGALDSKIAHITVWQLTCLFSTLFACAIAITQLLPFRYRGLSSDGRMLLTVSAESQQKLFEIASRMDAKILEEGRPLDWDRELVDEFGSNLAGDSSDLSRHLVAASHYWDAGERDRSLEILSQGEPLTASPILLETNRKAYLYVLAYQLALMGRSEGARGTFNRAEGSPATVPGPLRFQSLAAVQIVECAFPHALHSLGLARDKLRQMHWPPTPVVQSIGDTLDDLEALARVEAS